MVDAIKTTVNRLELTKGRRANDSRPANARSRRSGSFASRRCHGKRGRFAKGAYASGRGAIH